ncbi:MAG: tetratricopeptide repeat protein [Kofleriaceae bacterium]|nr:tetratricopeptide repeat protein [Kofleriaceae bacterium]MBP6836192.1 tetratricopeptide repeat protein [Kofleriaceae bacterium]
MVLAGALAIAAAVSPVTAAPRRGGKVSKPSKKALQIQRHEWMAQFHLVRAGDPVAAAREYEAILRLDKTNLSAGMALAQLYLRADKPKQAVDALRALAKKNGKAVEVWVALIGVATAAKDDKTATEALGKAVALAPRHREVVLIRYERVRDRALAGDAAAKAEALEVGPLALAALRPGSAAYREAERTMVKLTADPVALVVYDAKTAYDAAFESGFAIPERMRAAREGFESCIATQPANQECHFHLGMVLGSVKAGESYDPARALAELALAPDLPQALIETARLQRARDKNGEARAALEKALRGHPGHAVAHVELGILDKLDGKQPAAIGHFVAAIEKDRFSAAAERALGELTQLAPDHPLVTQGVMFGNIEGDVFSSDKFKAAVSLVEQQMGGVEADAPELPALRDIVGRLQAASGVGSRFGFKVAVLGTRMINAFAMPDGSMYVTRGMFDFLKKNWPNKPIDAKHDVLAHVMAHELTHVIRRHTVQSHIYQEAMKDANAGIEPAILTHVTRLHEIEADREGIVMAFLAGYHPRGGIQLMELLGKENEIPRHLDHPTFDERVQHLTEYWTNDVRYAFVSFKLGVGALDRAAKFEGNDLGKAVAAYKEGIEHLGRFRATLPAQKEVLHNLGVAHAKLGVLAMNAKDLPLGRWQTRWSLERDSAARYAGLVDDGDNAVKTRGSGDKKGRLNWQLREAIGLFKEALALDENYGKARLGLAGTYLAAGNLDDADDTLAKAAGATGVKTGEVELVRGIIAGERGQHDAALAAFTRAAGEAVSKQAASYNRARVLQLAGKKAEAKAAYLSYAKAFPQGPWAKAATAAADTLDGP